MALQLDRLEQHDISSVIKLCKIVNLMPCRICENTPSGFDIFIVNVIWKKWHIVYYNNNLQLISFKVVWVCTHMCRPYLSQNDIISSTIENQGVIESCFFLE